jgi:hypothetical protein
MLSTVAMQTKDVKWIVALLALVGLSLWLNRNRFANEPMIINPSLRPARRGEAAVWPVFFSLNNDFRLTSAKVVPWEGDKFNPLGRPIWHLISDSNSVPTRAFRYGQPIKGMKPALKGVQPEALEPDVNYRLLLQAGRVKAFKDFKTRAATP